MSNHNIEPKKSSLKARAIHELREFVVMFLYLLVPLSLFVAERAITLKEHGINYELSGLAIINALVLAKVMVIAEGMGLGTRRRERALIWLILNKSILFSVLFIVCHDVEEGLKGAIHGKRFIESMPLVGGSLIGLLVIGLNMAVALIPFFAYRELSRVIGPSKFKALLFAERDR